nr:hypothetical protein [Priestia megaterium]
MISEKTQTTERRGRNSEALCRGGGVRSSNEVAVMAMERRGTIIQLENWWKTWTWYSNCRRQSCTDGGKDVP